MTVSGLEAFWTAYREGSLRKAGTVLSRSQPALTYQIQGLEEELGELLFERRGKRLVPTELAKRLAPTVGEILGRLRDLPRQAKSLKDVREGTLTVVSNYAIGGEALGGTLRRFWKAYPGFRVHMINAPHDALRERVRTGRADLGITSAADVPATLEVRPLVRYRYVLLSRDPGTARTLLARGPLLTGIDSTPFRLLVDTLLTKLSLHPPIRAELAAIEDLPGLVQAGLGVAVLPEYALDARAPRGLRVTSLESELGNHAISAVSRPTAFLPPAAVEFESILGQELSRQSAAFRRRFRV